MKIWLIIALVIFSNSLYAHSLSIKGWRQNQTEGIIRQTTDFSCGPAALSLLLKEKFKVSIGEMEILSDILYRSESGSEQKKIQAGFSLLDLKNEAERLGYQAKGVRFDNSDDIAAYLPVIVLLQEDQYSHFVVLTELQNGYAKILDPEKGKVRMPFYQFKTFWNGYSLLVGNGN